MALSVVYFQFMHRLDRPHYVWDKYLYSVREKVEVRMTVCVTVCVVLLCCVGWWWKEGRRWNPVLAHSLLFSKSTKGAARLNVPIRRTNHYQKYYRPSQHTYCGRVWNLIQKCDVESSNQKVYISTPPRPEVENFQMKIYYPAGDRTQLNQRQTCYHLSQRSELGLLRQPNINWVCTHYIICTGIKGTVCFSCSKRLFF